jgi:hypothetical protein
MAVCGSVMIVASTTTSARIGVALLLRIDRSGAGAIGAG